MPGKLELVRRLTSSRYLIGIRDTFVRTAWHLDPDLSALQWIVLDTVFSPSRRKQFFSWMKYDYLYRRLKKELYANPEWRQGPQKSYEIAEGPLNALRFLTSQDIVTCRVLDFGCGGHFSDSTGLILYLYGVQSVDCLEIGRTISGFKNGAALDLFHWILDKMVIDEGLPFGSLVVDKSRLEEIHKLAVMCLEKNKPDGKFPVRIVEGDLLKLDIENESYDLITSNAVLEHVENPQEIWSVLKSKLQIGGVMHHVIDFRDHRFYSSPGQYVPLPALTKSNWKDRDTNGWRFDDWSELFNQKDLEVMKLTPEIETDGSIGLTQASAVASCEVIVRRIQ